MKIINDFAKHLIAIEYPKTKSSWNIAGIIKGQNAFYKFDVKDMEQISSGEWARKGNTKSKANKMVFELKNQWVILDLEELHKYIRGKKKMKVYVNDLIQELEWTIFLTKN